MKTLIIGSEHKEVNQVPVNLMIDLAYDKYHRLSALTIVRAISELKLARSVRCTYRDTPLKYFTLYGNNLKVIEQNNFPVLPLKVLSLVNNKLEAVRALSFDSHPIEDIDLSDNFLEVIERRALPLTNVTKIITVKNNRLSHIEDHSFPLALESLNLDGNRLRYMQPEVLSNLLALKELALSHNNFREMPPIKHLTELIVFDISFNFITNVEDGIFKNMNKLKLIDLSNNNIAQPDILKSLNTVRSQPMLTISLALNRLKDLDFGNVSFQRQTYILYGNPWDCNKWNHIKRNLLGHESKCDYEGPRSEDRPYCVSYSQESGDFLSSSREQEIKKFQELIATGERNFWCLWETRRNKWIFPINFGCAG